MVPKDLSKAVHVYRRAAAVAHPPAMYQLGYLHARGQGVDQDLTAAYVWMKAAAERGDENGRVGAEVLESKLTESQLAEAQETLAGVLTRAPRKVESAPVDYPELARVARLTGKVALQAVIDEDGELHDVEVLNCDRPNLGFEQAVLDSVAQWRFEPATFLGNPTAGYYPVTVDFNLK